MAQKQLVQINFAQGMNTKADPWQLPIGQFQNLTNIIFQKGGLMQKRPGYGILAAAPPATTSVTTLNGTLTAIGETVSAYSEQLQNWVTKGELQPCSLSTLPLIRNNSSQTQVDTVIADGMILTAYTEVTGSTTVYKYALADAITGQNIIAPTAIPAFGGGNITGSPRVFVVGIFFVIVCPTNNGGPTFLQYCSIPIANPINLSTNVPNTSAPQQVTSHVYTPVSANPGWDGVAVNSHGSGQLVVAFNSITGGQSVQVATLLSTQIALNQPTSTIFAETNAAYIAAILTICVDLTANPNVYYISFWNNATQNGYTFAVTTGFGTITEKFPPVQHITGTAVANLASCAQNNSCQLFAEIVNIYPYGSSIPTNYVATVPISDTGVVGAAYVVLLSVGIASKAFIVAGTAYILTAYQSDFQSTYFLLNATKCTREAPVIVAKLAYQNGGGYLTTGIPSVTVTGNTATCGYLFKDLVQALTSQNTTSMAATGGIFSQLGLNLVNFTLSTQVLQTIATANNLHISGGFLSQYDGYLPVEHNFLLFPDSIEAIWTATGGNIAAQPDGSTNTNAYAYQVTYEWTDNTGLPYRSAPSIPIFVTTTGTGNTGSIKIYVPMLRLTEKVSNPVKIVVYRWSVAQQTYHQVTSITAPVVNDTAQDATFFFDTLTDSNIVGNNILYTTGGVVADRNMDATNLLTLWDNRLWGVLAESPNTVICSKQVIQGTPVEVPSEFKIYVSPTTGTTQNLGPITSLFPFDDKLIFFFKEGLCYINGVGPDNLGTTSVGCSLGNYSQPIYIPSTIGCTNSNSIVLTPDGLMFQTDKGIWLLTHGLETLYIGAPIELYNGFAVTSAQVVPQTNYVLFTLRDTSTFLMYDSFYKQWGVFTGVAAIASCINNGLHTVLDAFGRVMQQTPGQFQDALDPVLMSFTTGWINLAGLEGYQRLYDFYLLANFLSPHELQCQMAYDYNSSVLHSTVIRPDNFSPSVPSGFGVPVPFGGPEQLERWRVHTKLQLCESFQLTLAEVANLIQSNTTGAGFTMSAILARIGIKSGAFPTAGRNSAGLNG